jgi:dihydrofolate synthase/folylpolyglutamate synthase
VPDGRAAVAGSPRPARERAPLTDAYPRTLAWLYRLQAQAGIELKLERVARAAAALGHPERAVAAVHVAGTNGKGSTVSMLAAMLRAGGHRVGVFTSPHLVSFRERIVVDGTPISEEEVVDGFAQLRRVLDPALGLTSFEFMTLLAWRTFAAQAVDVAVLEVGLGGRLDATNVVVPVASVITNVAVDHEAYLGAELEGIAAEKAGIIKAGVPVVSGVAGPAAAVVRARARALAAPYHARGEAFDLEVGTDGALVYRSPARTIGALTLALSGSYQRANAALAVRALEVAPRFTPSDAAVRAGLAAAVWPGRLQLVQTSPLVLLDCAHNPAAVDVVVEEVRLLAAGRRVRALFGVMRDKAWHSMLQSLGGLAAEIVLTRPRQPRSAEPDELATATPGPYRVEPDPVAAYRALVARSAAADVVLVTGSIFLIGDVLPAVDERWAAAAAREREATRLAGWA